MDNIGLYYMRTRVQQRDISELLELLAPYAYKWREIGTQLKFTRHELNNIQCDPMTMLQGNIGYLRAMLSQWVQWTPDGSHHCYATFLDLHLALESQTVNLGDDAKDVCSKIWDMRIKRIEEKICEGVCIVQVNPFTVCNDDKHDDDSDAEYFTCDEMDDQDEQATTKKGLFSKMRKGVRKLFGAAKDMTAGFIKKAIRTLNLDVMVTRKYKKRHDKFTNRDVTRWWFEIWGDETALKKMEGQWEEEVAAKHKWRLETCPVGSQRN